MLAWSLSWPTWGCARLAAQLAREGIVTISPSTVQRILRRSGLATRRDRLAVLEAHSAESAGLLTERTRRALAKARSKERHVEASEPGELVCLEQAAAFLEEVLVPLYTRAGWPIQRVLTDGGSEFKGAFAKACRRLQIAHTRTKPRHAWTNGFVERLQGTLLHEHWRIEFRRRSFTRLGQLDRSLQAFLEFYNHQRPHQGHRTRGRTPGEINLGRRPANQHVRRSKVQTPLRVWTN